MAKFKEGDRVAIVAREHTAADVKSGLYYPHYANLHGTILKVYANEASVLVDRDILPAEILKRHEESEKAERQRYLDRLSEDARGKAGQREKNFSLNYSVLVAVSDLKPYKGAAPTRSDASGDTTAPAKRVTETELDAAEAAFLAQRGKNGAGA
jgi:hypothetical protein